VALIVGPPSAGKSLLAFNMIHRMPTITALAFLLDTTPLTATSRFASIISREPYKDVKQGIIDGDERYRSSLNKELPNVRVSFKAPAVEDVQREVDAWEQRFGLPPDLVLIDNFGNQSGLFDNEWAALKAMALEYDELARDYELAVVGCHHTTDLPPEDPAARDKVLGKGSQFPRLMLSVGFNSETAEYKVAIVKNSEGKTDAKAKDPITLYADPERMLLSEYPIARRVQDRGPEVSGDRAMAGTSGRLEDSVSAAGDGPPW